MPVRLSYVEVEVLHFVGMNRGCKPEHIAESLSYPEDYVERALMKLAEAGLIHPNEGGDDAGYH